MKKVFKIIAYIILSILILAFVLPLVFKSKLKEIAEEELNNKLNAKVEFSDFGLSLFRNFPDFTVSLDGLSIVGKGDFVNDTLASIASVQVSVNLFSVINGSKYEIETVQINEPNIMLKVLKDGSANYNISLNNETDPKDPTDESQSADVNLELKNFEIKNANILFEDAQTDLNMEIVNLNHSLRGNLSADKTILNTKTNIQSFTLDNGGVNYLKNVSVNYKAGIDADLKNDIYTLMKNDLMLNQLNIRFNGSVSLIEEDINLVMTFDAPATEFKELLSLVPVVYSKDFKNIETSGKFNFEGNVKGIYNENNLPAFNFELGVDNAMFKYPDLPKAVSEVNISARVSNTGGDADYTIINIPQLKMKLGGNPVDINMLIKTPVSDPDIKAKIKGNMNLATIKDFYPLDDEESLKGEILADINLDGKMSALELEQYEDFTAIGSLLLKGMSYRNPSMKELVEIGIAQLNFSPQYLDLVSFKSKLGKNDFSANGKFQDYLNYIFKDEMLKGNLQTSSDFFNISDLMPNDDYTEYQTESSEDTISLSVIQIPDNIGFVMQSSFNTLIYDDLEMKNVNGHIEIRDQTVFLKNMSMNTLEGEMEIKGMYSTKNIDKPEIDFNLDMKSLDIQKSYHSFQILQTYVPLAAKTSGTFSSVMNFRSLLDEQMMPEFSTISGGGELLTSDISAYGINTLEKLSELLNVDKLKNLDIKKILVQFEFVDGKLITKPFDFKSGEFTGNLSGGTAYDQSIDYVMNIELPRSLLGANANSTVNDILGKAQIDGDEMNVIPLAVNISGTLSNPVLKTGFNDMGKNLTDAAKEIVKEEIKKKKEEISKEVQAQAAKIIEDADKQAQQLIAEAEKQATNIRNEANNGAKQIREEAEKQAKNLEAEGKKNGVIAEMAAKKAAKKLRDEADIQAEKLTSEADKQAGSLVNNANNQATQIKKKAQEEADKLLKN